MITFNEASMGMVQIKKQTEERLDKELAGARLPNELYVFGVKRLKYEAQVYISPTIPEAQKLADFLLTKGISSSVEEVGNTSRKYWIAIRRDLRTDKKDLCVKVCCTALFCLNSLISW